MSILGGHEGALIASLALEKSYRARGVSDDNVLTLARLAAAAATCNFLTAGVAELHRGIVQVGGVPLDLSGRQASCEASTQFRCMHSTSGVHSRTGMIVCLQSTRKRLLKVL